MSKLRTCAYPTRAGHYEIRGNTRKKQAKLEALGCLWNPGRRCFIADRRAVDLGSQLHGVEEMLWCRVLRGSGTVDRWMPARAIEESPFDELDVIVAVLDPPV